MNGITMFIFGRQRHQKTIRIRLQKPGRKIQPKFDRLVRLTKYERHNFTHQQRKAIKNYLFGEITKIETGIASGYTPNYTLNVINNTPESAVKQQLMKKAVKKKPECRHKGHSQMGGR